MKIIQNKHFLMRHLSLVIFVLFMIITINNSVSFASIISDPVVEKAVRDSIHKPVGTITSEDCIKVKELNINLANLPNLKTLEVFPNLEELSVSNSHTTDITSLSNLKKLKSVSFGGNEIVSLEPLTSLPLLGEFTMTQIFPVNLEPISRMKSLWHIQLNHVPISDLNLFNNLSNLRILTLYDNQISDVTPLSKHKQLVILGIGRNLVSDIRPLASLTNLESLQIIESELSSVSDIQNVIKNMKLTELYLFENPVRDYSALKPFFQKLSVNQPDMMDHYNEIQTLALACSKIMDSIIKPSMSEVEKELAIHDYIVEHTEYDSTYATASGSAKGPILNGKGFCNGYSLAFTLLTRYAGFECYFVEGHVGIVPIEEDEYTIDHAWNKIRIGGVLHNVDVTWDEKKNGISYDYFNRADNEMVSHWEYPLYPKAPGGNTEWMQYAFPELSAPIKATFKIALPNNEKAFDSRLIHGIPVQINIVNMKMEGVSDIIFKKSLNVVIPNGQNSIIVSTWIPSDLNLIDIWYDIPASRVVNNMAAERGWVSSAHFSKNGTHNEINIDYLYKSSDFENTTTNLTLLKGVKVSGNVQLPPGFVNTTGIDITSQMTTGFTSLHILPTLFLPKGKTSAPFITAVPEDREYTLSFTTYALGCETTTYLTDTGLDKTMTDYKFVIGSEAKELPLLTIPYNAQHAGSIFKDVKMGSQLEADSVTLYMKGILSGDGNGNVLPSSLVSRAEFATMLVKMKGEEDMTKSVANCRFTDVGKTKWYMKFVEVAAELQLLSGTGNGNFSPEGNVTGVQALYAICRLFTTTEALNATYPDKNWKEVAVLAAKEYKIIDPADVPSENAVTREQIIKYLVVALEKMD